MTSNGQGCLTLVELFANRAAKTPQQDALFTKCDGSFHASTWNDLDRQVKLTAAALHKIGVRPGDRVAQYADNSEPWIVADLAIQSLQAIHVPIHAPLSADQVVHQIRHSGSQVVLLGDQQQVQQLSTLDAATWRDLTFVATGPLAPLNGSVTHQLDDLWNEVDVDEGAKLVAEARDRLTPDSIATILYTSGTTGIPKGVVLSHENLVSNTLATIDAFGIDENDLRLCFLPFSHIYARTCDIYTWIARGSELAIASNRETILQDCMRLGPTMLNGVPYFYQRVHRYLVEQKRDDEAGSLLKILGGKVRLCCCGGAALPNYLYDFFQQHEIPLLQGYGLSESSPVITLNSPSHHKRGSVGRAIPGVELKIADDNEILARGPNVMRGYWNDPEATAETIRDGWLYTGDYGSLDDQDYLFITGRKKDLIVTAAGKNIAPTQIERLLCEDPLIAQAVVIGDGRNYLTALIVPDPDNIKKELLKLRIVPISKRWVLTHPRILELYQDRIAARLDHLSHHEQIRRFHLMDRGFTPETGEMTPKLSLKRSLIQENCHEFIDAMYARPRTDAPVTWPQHVVTFMRSLWA